VKDDGFENYGMGSTLGSVELAETGPKIPIHNSQLSQNYSRRSIIDF
jgi:hypothetical protein